MARTKQQKSVESEILVVTELHGTEIEVWAVGTAPTLQNPQSQKAKQELLLPGRPKNRAEKSLRLKHDPIAEFRDSVYRFTDPAAPTLLAARGPAFKRAAMTATKYVPGLDKTDIARLFVVVDEYVPLYGVPMLDMRSVVQAGMSRTPDIRTRVILTNWAVPLRVRFASPPLTANAISSLLSNAGLWIGVFDGRQEKGALSYGLFRLATADDPEVQTLVRTGGRAVQEAAMEAAEPWNDESRNLLSWYLEEAEMRGLGVTQPQRAA